MPSISKWSAMVSLTVADHFRPQINKLDWHVKLGLATSHLWQTISHLSLEAWLTMADHFAMDGIADYSIISGLQTTYIQRSTTALNHPICCICQCKFLNNRISRRKCIRLAGRERDVPNLPRTVFLLLLLPSADICIGWKKASLPHTPAPVPRTIYRTPPHWGPMTAASSSSSPTLQRWQIRMLRSCEKFLPAVA